MWITNKGLMQEYVIDAHTGIKKIVSVKVSGNSKKAEQEAYTRLQDKIQKMSETRFLFSDMIELYLKDKQKEWKPASYSQAKDRIHQILKVIGDGYLDSFTAGYIRLKFAESGKSNHTLNDYLIRLKAFWRWAYQNDFVKSMDVPNKLTNYAEPQHATRIQDKYLETKEIEKLLNAMDDERYKLASRFLLLTGMRVGEFIAINDKDIWGTIIRINKTYDKANHIVTTAKTVTSAREIHIQPELKECIDDIRKFEQYQREVCGYESDLFFPDTDGTFFKYGSFNKYIGNLTEKVLGRRLNPHAFRHTHASVLAMKGFPLESISVRLGHNGSQITKEIYLHRMKELKERENRQLDLIRMLD